MLFVVEFVVTPTTPVCCDELSSVNGRPGESFWSQTGLTTVPILLMYGPFSDAGIFFLNYLKYSTKKK